MNLSARAKVVALVAAMTTAAVCATSAIAGVPPPMTYHKELMDIAAAVKVDNLRASDKALVNFGTRNTALRLKSKTRGVIAASHWIADRFQTISKQCNGCLKIVQPWQVFKGPRLRKEGGVKVQDVVAIQRGTTDPDRVIVITAHLDSINSKVFKSHWKDNTGDAPGADDDAAGVSAMLEIARVLSQYKFPATLVYSADAGEEQGLYGGRIIAQYAVDHEWKVEADLNNDMVGNSHGGNGVYKPHFIRIYSQGRKSHATPKQLAASNALGGNSDSPSRNVARYMASLANQYLTNFHVRLVYMTDRWGRGGDEEPFLLQGYPAVRLAESAEAYNRQHQVVRTEDGVHYGDVFAWVDFDYLANVARLDAITMASMAMAPAPVSDLKISGAVSYHTTVKWKKVDGAASYNVWWRETTAPQWQHVAHAGDTDTLKLENVIIDDYFFGVSSVSADGWESPVEFPGYAGSFKRSPKLNPDGKPVHTLYPGLSAHERFGGKAVGTPSWRQKNRG